VSKAAGNIPAKVVADAVAPNRRRGGDIRVLLSPLSVGATSGFMGVGTLDPGERIIRHLHPYSEEFMYVVRGALLATVGGEQVEVGAGEGFMVPMNTEHELVNPGTEPVFVVFHSSPLAPRPELGHVDLEPTFTDEQNPQVGGPDGRS
jgi:putative monooxygenase